MKRSELLATTAYLHEHIPLSQAMQAEVIAFDGTSVALRAPLQPNINHRETVFGGSAVSLAILTGWTLLHLNLRAAGLSARIVIQTSAMNYTRPILADFTARSHFTEQPQWERFLQVAERKRAARIELPAILTCNDEPVADFSGKYVALVSN